VGGILLCLSTEDIGDDMIYSVQTLVESDVSCPQSKVLWSPPSLEQPFRNICVTNDERCVPLVVITISPFHIHDLSPDFDKNNTTGPTSETGTYTFPEHLRSSPVISGFV
jgi:hypothetical protein